MISATWDTVTTTYVVRSPFAAKDAIKSLPFFARRWDADQKVWRVDAGFIEDLRRELTDDGFKLQVTGGPADGSTTHSNWVEGAFADCPPGQEASLRRALMRVFHPDAGGNHEVAQQINTVADEVERKQREETCPW